MLYKRLHAIGYNNFTIPKLTYFEVVFLLEDVKTHGVPVHKFKEDELRIKMLAKNALRRK